MRSGPECTDLALVGVGRPDVMYSTPDHRGNAPERQTPMPSSSIPMAKTKCPKRSGAPLRQVAAGRSVVAKLELTEERKLSRRVAAVLAYLYDPGQGSGTGPTIRTD